jgi:hypothetical protein
MYVGSGRECVRKRYLLITTSYFTLYCILSASGGSNFTFKLRDEVKKWVIVEQGKRGPNGTWMLCRPFGCQGDIEVLLVSQLFVYCVPPSHYRYYRLYAPSCLLTLPIGSSMLCPLAVLGVVLCRVTSKTLYFPTFSRTLTPRRCGSRVRNVEVTEWVNQVVYMAI